MDKGFLNSLDIFEKRIQEAVSNGQLHGSPFVDYSNSAAAIFAGFTVIAELLQIDLIRESIEGEEERLLDARQKSGLLGLLMAASSAMEEKACHISDWAWARLGEGNHER